ncbi:MAG TPA: DUF2782 domain-containing protein [Burkholderiales bacterium]|nr:DUF2782 domain-containing protein [Burkholderiales bacterium]
MLRSAFLAALLVAPLSFAQAPPKLEPLPPVPPAPPGVSDIPDEPRVRIAPQAESVEEVREGDRVIGYRVTPRGGIPFYLVDTTGNGNWMRRDSLDDGVRVPMWRLFSF